MRLFVTGGAGHTGCNFLRLFLSDNDKNNAVVLVKPTTDRSYLPKAGDNRIEIVEGDIRTESISQFMSGCDALMHIAHQTLCPAIVDQALKSGVRRVFFVTTTGVFSKFNDLSNEYKQIENQIRQSNLDWTILRPTMIFGSERDANLHKLLRYLNSYSVFPVFGDGNGLMQPVYVGDLAEGLLLATKNGDATVRKEYNLSGEAPLTYNNLVKVAAKELNRNVRLVHVPYAVSLALSMAAETVLGKRSPIVSEQVRRLKENKAFSWSEARSDFGYSPGTFVDRIHLEVERLRAVGLIA